MTKAEQALDLTRRAAALSGSPSRVLVALSGGKDSLVTLDLCAQAFDHVEAFYMFIVAGLRSVEDDIEAACRRSGVKQLHRVPSFVTHRMVKYGVLRPPVADGSKLAVPNRSQIQKRLRAKTGINWMAGGERMNESIRRRGMLHRCSGLDVERQTVYPIWDWSARDVWAYLRARKIPGPVRMPGSFVSTEAADRATGASGFGLNPACLAWLKENYPDDYQRVKEAFPFAEALLARFKFYPDKQRPAVRRRTRASKADKPG